MIDRIRHDIQERLDQLLAKVDKLRDALVAWHPRGRQASEPKPVQHTRAQFKPAANRPARKATSRRSSSARTPKGAASSVSGSATSKRPALGETRAWVLAALSSDEALTAADVAKSTGLADRPSKRRSHDSPRAARSPRPTVYRALKKTETGAAPRV